MDILSIFIIAIGLAMDSFAVSISRGMCSPRFYVWQAVKISFIFGFFQGFMPLIGYGLGFSYSSYMESYDHWLAFIILTIIGIKMIYESFNPEENQDSWYNAYSISWKNVVIMAIATSIDALATGLIFAAYPGFLVKAVIIIAVVTFVFAFVGRYLGVYFGQKIRLNVELIGGLILIGIGTKILLQHTLPA